MALIRYIDFPKLIFFVGTGDEEAVVVEAHAVGVIRGLHEDGDFTLERVLVPRRLVEGELVNARLLHSDRQNKCRRSYRRSHLRVNLNPSPSRTGRALRRWATMSSLLAGRVRGHC